jgi:hypothetical protein
VLGQDQNSWLSAFTLQETARQVSAGDTGQGVMMLRCLFSRCEMRLIVPMVCAVRDVMVNFMCHFNLDGQIFG